MRKLLCKNKKGVSEIISYVLLVIIALGLSILVYAYLKVYIPKDKKLSCPDDIHVVLNNYRCYTDQNNNKMLSINVQNKGLFKIDAAYVRLGKQEKLPRQINDDIKILNPEIENPTNKEGFQPGTNWVPRPYDVGGIVTQDGTYILQIDPVIYIKKKEVVCDKAIIRQIITCPS